MLLPRRPRAALARHRAARPIPEGPCAARRRLVGPRSRQGAGRQLARRVRTHACDERCLDWPRASTYLSPRKCEERWTALRATRQMLACDVTEGQRWPQRDPCAGIVAAHDARHVVPGGIKA